MRQSHSTSSITPEIRIRATTVPVSMARTSRCEIRVKTWLSPVGVVFNSGALASNQALALAVISRNEPVVANGIDALMRRVDRVTLIWSVRSMP